MTSTVPAHRGLAVLLSMLPRSGGRGSGGALRPELEARTMTGIVRFFVLGLMRARFDSGQSLRWVIHPREHRGGRDPSDTCSTSWLSLHPGRIGRMPEKIWTAEELERLTPDERDRLFEDSIVRDLDDAPSDLVDRARERLQERIQADANP